MNRYAKGAFAVLAGAAVMAAGACSGGVSTSSSNSGSAGGDSSAAVTHSDSPSEATLVTDENMSDLLDGYSHGPYSSSAQGFPHFQCKKTQERVALDDFSGMSREVNGETNMMNMRFANKVPSMLLITMERTSVVFALGGGSHDFTINLGFAGIPDADGDFSFTDNDVMLAYGVDHPKNYYNEDLFEVCY